MTQNGTSTETSLRPWCLPKHKPLQTAAALRPCPVEGRRLPRWPLEYIRRFGLTATVLVAPGCRVHLHIGYDRSRWLAQSDPAPEEEEDRRDDDGAEPGAAAAEGEEEEEEEASGEEATHSGKTDSVHALDRCQLFVLPRAVRRASWLLSLARQPQTSWFEAWFLPEPDSCAPLRGSLQQRNKRGEAKFCLRTEIPPAECYETTVSYSFEYLLHVPAGARVPAPLVADDIDVQAVLLAKLEQIRPCYDVLLAAVRDGTSASRVLHELLPEAGWDLSRRRRERVQLFVRDGCDARQVALRAGPATGTAAAPVVSPAGAEGLAQGSLEPPSKRHRPDHTDSAADGPRGLAL